MAFKFVYWRLNSGKKVDKERERERERGREIDRERMRERQRENEREIKRNTIIQSTRFAKLIVEEEEDVFVKTVVGGGVFVFKTTE
jgi:hypothetical protein